MDVTNSKQLVSAFLQFMQNEMNKAEFSENTDNKKNLENAFKSLQSAYMVTYTELPNNEKSLEDLFLKPSTKTSDEVSNNKATMVASKYTDLYKMSKSLNEYDEKIVSDKSVSWLKQSATIALETYESLKLRKLASGVFHKTCEQASKIPGCYREIANTELPKIVDTILSSKKEIDEPILLVLKSIVDVFPKCGEFKNKRGKLCKLLYKFICCFDETLQNLSISIWSKLPVIGSGGGHDDKLFTDAWNMQMKEAVDALEYCVHFICDDEHCGERRERLDSIYGSTTLHLKIISDTEPQASRDVIQRYISVCKCICALFDLNLESSVQVPFKKMIDLINKLITLFDETRLQTHTMRARQMYFAEMELSTVKLLRHIAKSLPKTQFDFVNYFLYRGLGMIKDTKFNKSNKIRSEYFEFVSLWLREKDRNSNFVKKEQCQDEKTIYQILVDDIKSTGQNLSIVSDATVSKKNQNNNNGRSKKKRNMLADDTKNVATGCLYDEKSQIELCKKALKVAVDVVYIYGLEHDENKQLQNTVVNLVNKLLIEDDSTVLYLKSESLRKSLFELLEAVCYQEKVPAHLKSAACSFMQVAYNFDSSTDVKSFCHKSLFKLSALQRTTIIREAFSYRNSKAEESEPEDEEVLSDVETEVENSTVMTVEAVNVETEENNEMNTDCSNSERVVISNGDVDLTAVQNEDVIKSSDVASDVKVLENSADEVVEKNDVEEIITIDDDLANTSEKSPSVIEEVGAKVTEKRKSVDEKSDEPDTKKSKVEEESITVLSSDDEEVNNVISMLIDANK